MQTRAQSLFEIFLNLITGYVVGVLIQVIMFPFYGMHLSLGQNLTLGLIFTASSVIRGYAWRRYWNKKHWQRYLEEHHHGNDH